jgi:hypothetical protein
VTSIILRRAAAAFLASAICLMIALGVISASATPYHEGRYVDLAGLCDGHTPCYTSIGAAVAASVAGDTVYVLPGLYPESVNLSTMAEPGDLRLITTNSKATPSPRTATVDPGAPGGSGAGEAFYNSTVPLIAK